MHDKYWAMYVAKYKLHMMGSEQDMETYRKYKQLIATTNEQWTIYGKHEQTQETHDKQWPYTIVTIYMCVSWMFY